MTERLYRVRRTVLQMLRDRGYYVDLADIDETEDAFTEKFTQMPNRDAMTILVQKKDNPSDQIYVFWPTDPKIGVKPVQRCLAASIPFLSPLCALVRRARCRQPVSRCPPSTRLRMNIHRYFEKMKEDEVKRAIIVVQQQMTNFAKEKVCRPPTPSHDSISGWVLYAVASWVQTDTECICSGATTAIRGLVPRPRSSSEDCTS